jgi:hypothetical protein
MPQRSSEKYLIRWLPPAWVVFYEKFFKVKYVKIDVEETGDTFSVKMLFGYLQ